MKKNIWIFFLGLLVSCAPSHRTMLEPARDVSFASMRVSILEPRCLGCHQEFGTYEGVRKNLEAIQDRVFVRKDMPPGPPLSSADLQSLRDWLDSGAPVIQPTHWAKPTRLPDGLKWDGIKAQVLGSCLTCHSAPTPEAQLDLSNKGEFKKYYLKVLDRAVFNTACPLPPEPTLNAPQKDALISWIRGGMN